MPFGKDCEFMDMEACIAAHSDKDDPAAFCATLMRETEEHCKSRSVGTKKTVGGLEVDGQKFGVKLTIDPIGGDDGPRMFLGKTDEAENIIVIDGTMPTTRQEEVLLHEMIHLCDMSLPEYIVSIISTRLYGSLRANGLLVDDMVAKVSSGVLTKEETDAINQESEEMEEAMQNGAMPFRVSRAAWDGSRSRFSAEQWQRSILAGSDRLPVREPDGRPNVAAMHIAAARLVGGYGGSGLSPAQRRIAIRDLARLFAETKETAPVEIARMAKDD